MRQSSFKHHEERLTNSAALHRWLYRGQKPNWIARILNRAWAAVASVAVTPFNLVTLEVIGRTSQRVVVLPLVMAVVDGQRYLVSMLGEDAQWVRNVRKANGHAILRRGNREAVRLVEVPPDQRAPILQAYLQRASGARPHLPIDKDAPLADFAAIAPAYPVFRVVSDQAG